MIRFEIARVTKTYNEKAMGIEGAKPSTGTFFIFFNKPVSWYPMSIDGSRERYSLQFNRDGTLKSFTQD